MVPGRNNLAIGLLLNYCHCYRDVDGESERREVGWQLDLEGQIMSGEAGKVFDARVTGTKA